jgi:16S rRNA (cytosine1402-N4)-methyltransferase
MATTSRHSTDAAHVPVLLDEVLRVLEPKDGGVYIDGTFGAGGYTRAILDAAQCTVHAIDRDPSAIARAKEMAKEYSGRLIPHEGCFGSMKDLLAVAGVSHVDGPTPCVDGIVLDIGVSSMQIDQPARGFSFRSDGPLDMRMSASGESAADVVNTYGESELADIIYNYGEERAARRIAKKIVASRPLKTTADLVRIVHEVLPMHGGLKSDTATRTFQALRIHVNDELGELERALDAAEELLMPGGRLVVVTFHSLEDSKVKNFLREKSGRAPGVSRHVPVAAQKAPPVFIVEKNSGLKPSDAECARNPRARSATLRWGVRA